MLDATGKIKSGFLRLGFTDFGNYDQCIKSEKTRYCRLRFKHPLPDWTVFEEGERIIMEKIADENFMKKFVRYHSFLYAESVLQGICVPATCSTSDLNLIALKVSSKASLPFRLSVSCDEDISRAKSAKFASSILILCTLFTIAATLFVNHTSYVKGDLAVLTNFDIVTNTKAIFRVSSNPDTRRLMFFGGIRLVYLLVTSGLHYFIVACTSAWTLYCE